jgi:C-terminal processing protease CtpA/Prc
VRSISRATRKSLLAKRNKLKETPIDSLLQFKLIEKGTIGYLKVGTFASYMMKKDFKAFFEKSFATLKAKNIQKLILDIRGNEGGSDEMAALLTSYLSTKPITVEPNVQLVAFQQLSPELLKYNDSYSKEVFDLRDRTEKFDARLYSLKNNSVKTIAPQATAFGGKTVLLIDEANSSASFLFAKQLAYNKLVTTLGKETGGALSGINASKIAFLKLPETGIEVDIPLIATYFGNQENKGLIPDISTSRNEFDFLSKTDSDLAEAIKLLKKTVR